MMGLPQRPVSSSLFLDHDDLLTADALERVKAVVEKFDDVDYIYSDEDKVDQHGNFFGAFLKPDWSPERLRGQMYTSHLSVIRRSVVHQVGGFREGYDGSQDHDLVLRVTEQARRVVHIPHVLYHWRAVPGVCGSDASGQAVRARRLGSGRSRIRQTDSGSTAERIWSARTRRYTA